MDQPVLGLSVYAGKVAELRVSGLFSTSRSYLPPLFYLPQPQPVSMTPSLIRIGSPM